MSSAKRRNRQEPLEAVTYRGFLTDPDAAFSEWTLDDIVDRWSDAAVGEDETAWLAAFRERYLDLHLSEPAYAN